ncbi:MAG: glycosyltransferase family 2 protein [Eubacterium sp.]|nr:glycosyltransferase family 2 protein [Eubacterium sp.]
MTIKYNIDEIQIEGETLTVQGWAAQVEEKADKSTNLKSTKIYVTRKNGARVSAELTRQYRSDVILALDGVVTEEMLGFQIRFSGNSGENKYIIYFQSSDGKQSEPYPVDFNTVSMLSRQNGRHFKGVWDMMHHLNGLMIRDDFQYLLQFGPEKLARLYYKRLNNLDEASEYEKWVKRHKPTSKELVKQRNYHFSYMPKISIVIPAYRTNQKFLKELLRSIRKQTYSRWQLCIADGSGKDHTVESIVKRYVSMDRRICYKKLEENEGISGNTNEALKMADGDYILLCDHDDVVPPNALFELVKALQDREVDLVYTDEDKISMDSRKLFCPNFKPDFNPDLLCSMNYICHLFLFPRNFYLKYGGFRSEFDGAQDYDLILRYTERARKISHIPKVLYHWRSHPGSTSENPESKSYAFENGKKAVEEHYRRIGIPAYAENGPMFGTYHTTYTWPRKPLISIIVPNKDHIEDLKKCMDSVDQKSIYRNYEWIIVENNSTEEETFRYYNSIRERDNVTVLNWKGEFNYSKINNFGAKQAKGELLLLLNNDTEMIRPESLKAMAGLCQREDVGIVGARLLYPDNTIQHAGVIIGLGGVAGHAFTYLPAKDPGYMRRAIVTQDYSAVTAACMMVKKDVFEAVGGLTEEYAVAFNDIDFCMKVGAAGKRIVYEPASEFYHYESKSRGLEDTKEKVKRFQSEVERFQKTWKAFLVKGDPYYNPNLSLSDGAFRLRQETRR